MAVCPVLVLTSSPESPSEAQTPNEPGKESPPPCGAELGDPVDAACPGVLVVVVEGSGRLHVVSGASFVLTSAVLNQTECAD